MKITISLFTALLLSPLAVLHAADAPQPPANSMIDRHALVTRHNIEWNDPAGQIPLGNGEFCFNADGTGLQTLGGGTVSHWGWHSDPLPVGWTADRVPPTGIFRKGLNTQDFPPGTEAIRKWMIENPHTLNLGRLRLCNAVGEALKPTDISGLVRKMDLWSGVQTSIYQVNGEPVRVETCVHPTLDAVVVRIESPLIARGELQVIVDFPGPSGSQTEPKRTGDSRFDVLRTVDATTYHVGLSWSAGGMLAESGDHYSLSAKGVKQLELVCAFSTEKATDPLPSAHQSFAATAQHWSNFWSTGGAIDLSGSKDPRWMELERRIVLSQYHMAAQSAGSYPSSESGLMGNDGWHGQFHMEMVWWHLAHYALWDRWAMCERALGCYQRFTPAARALASQLGYAGLKWPKAVGPEGRSAPWGGNHMLLWKQPHPIFFAELDYRLHPTRATLDKWADVVQGTAEHMADYPTWDAKTGVYSLAPVIPPSETGVTRDSVFDLAYWRFGLDKAQEWRERRGLAREPHWDDVRQHLAPLPVDDGVYLHSPEWRDTYTKRNWEHPNPIGVVGQLPPVKDVDVETAHRTALKIWTTWQWDRTWGWDLPWMAMAAARTGEPQIAIDALLKESPRNRYDQRGVNIGGGPGGYLPGNGGLLYAVAMMAAGWDGCPDKPAPGFPADGSWTVKYEGLKKAP